MAEHDDDLTWETKNNSGVKGDLDELTREEARAIKRLVEEEMRENGYKYRLGGENWADLDSLRTKVKLFLRENQ